MLNKNKIFQRIAKEEERKHKKINEKEQIEDLQQVLELKDHITSIDYDSQEAE